MPNLYDLTFSAKQWQEIESLGFEPFEPMTGESLTRGQWCAIGEMCLGKAQRIDAGDYGMEDGEGNATDADLEAVGDSPAQWAEDLRGIAAIIFREFKSGDGRL